MHYKLEWGKRILYAFELSHLKQRAARITEHWVIYDRHDNIVEEGNRDDSEERKAST